jgi:hypothetical protein
VSYYSCSPSIYEGFQPVIIQDLLNKRYNRLPIFLHRRIVVVDQEIGKQASSQAYLWRSADFRRCKSLGPPQKRGRSSHGFSPKISGPQDEAWAEERPSRSSPRAGTPPKSPKPTPPRKLKSRLRRLEFKEDEWRAQRPSGR